MNLKLAKQANYFFRFVECLFLYICKVVVSCSCPQYMYMYINFVNDVESQYLS